MDANERDLRKVVKETLEQHDKLTLKLERTRETIVAAFAALPEMICTCGIHLCAKCKLSDALDKLNEVED